MKSTPPAAEEPVALPEYAPAPARKKPGAKKGAKQQPHRLRLRRDLLEKALLETGGVYAWAAKKLRCSANTVKNYVLRDPSLLEVIAQAQDAMLDDTEAGLIELIRKRHPTAIIFMLKTKGKHRGYIERSEVTGAGGGPVAMTFDIEQLERIQHAVKANTCAQPAETSGPSEPNSSRSR